MASSTDQHPHFLCSKTIIISGAGIAGLTFAVALSQQFTESGSLNQARPRLVIYERDSYEDRIGREGYSLSLRTDNSPGGIQVLGFLGIYERVRRVSVNPEDSAEVRGGFNIWNSDFSSLLRFAVRNAGPNDLLGMRIRRNALQKVLADAAVEHGATIHWETAIKGAEPTGHGQMEVSLSDGSRELCDILIAADGSRSKVRSLLRPNDGLDYTGFYTWGGTAKYPSRNAIPKPLDRDWGVVLGGKGIGLFVSPVDDKSVLWGMSRASPREQASLRYPIPQQQYIELMEESTKLASNFAPLVKKLVAATDPTTAMLFSCMDRPPFPNQPLKHGPVVWIGDANHAVSPFAGNGANMALMDAWDLASSLKKADSFDEALSEFDKVAVTRATKVLNTSRWSIDLAHATGFKLVLYKLFIGVIGFLSRRIPF